MNAFIILLMDDFVIMHASFCLNEMNIARLFHFVYKLVWLVYCPGADCMLVQGSCFMSILKFKQYITLNVNI